MLHLSLSFGSFLVLAEWWPNPAFCDTPHGNEQQQIWAWECWSVWAAAGTNGVLSCGQCWGQGLIPLLQGPKYSWATAGPAWVIELLQPPSKPPSTQILYTDQLITRILLIWHINLCHRALFPLTTLQWSLIMKLSFTPTFTRTPISFWTMMAYHTNDNWGVMWSNQFFFSWQKNRGEKHITFHYFMLFSHNKFHVINYLMKWWLNGFAINVFDRFLQKKKSQLCLIDIAYNSIYKLASPWQKK